MEIPHMSIYRRRDRNACPSPWPKGQHSHGKDNNPPSSTLLARLIFLVLLCRPQDGDISYLLRKFQGSLRHYEYSQQQLWLTGKGRNTLRCMWNTSVQVKLITPINKTNASSFLVNCFLQLLSALLCFTVKCEIKA